MLKFRNVWMMRVLLCFQFFFTDLHFSVAMLNQQIQSWAIRSGSNQAWGRIPRKSCTFWSISSSDNCASSGATLTSNATSSSSFSSSASFGGAGRIGRTSACLRARGLPSIGSSSAASLPFRHRRREAGSSVTERLSRSSESS